MVNSVTYNLIQIRAFCLLFEHAFYWAKIFLHVVLVTNEWPVFETSPTERSNSDVTGVYDVTVTSINSGIWTSPKKRSLLVVRYWLLLRVAAEVS